MAKKPTKNDDVFDLKFKDETGKIIQYKKCKIKEQSVDKWEFEFKQPLTIK
jgi:hypothetical protein